MARELDTIKRILQIVEDLGHIKDLDTLLDRILHEARLLTNADAGSIYLVEDDKLNFTYVQNDTLFKGDTASKYFYSDKKMPVNQESIAGYAAYNGKTVMIDDAYNIDDSVPYTFNTSFDISADYKTTSIMATPLKTAASKIVGVLQIINSKDKDGNSVPFTEEHRVYLEYFGTNAAVAIERALLTRELILRMLKMSELRDPKETGAHVNRVGAYSAELYEAWANKNNISADEIKATKDIVRLSSMLHDVGKVAISDLILKKPARLTKDEFELMKYHTIYGARLFRDPKSEMDRLSGEIALNHHEKWDGTGYPGYIKGDLYKNEIDEILMGKGKKMEEIPLFGRICAIADVYDALISKRVYKNAWSEDEVLDHFREQSGKHFDPELVECFFSIYDTIKAIRNKFREE
ncbi:MAG: HD domain-containing phosphohydrolase [Candidatus Muiribacteriaceae bacterium]